MLPAAFRLARLRYLISVKKPWNQTATGRITPVSVFVYNINKLSA